MKKFQLFLLIFLTYFVFNSCQEDTTSPKNGCEYTIDNRLASLYDCPPSVEACYEGTLANTEKMVALDRLNYIRGIHGLPAVTYNFNKDADVQKSALIAVANETLTHFPEPEFKCYTTAGDTACQQSNLHISFFSSLSQVWSSSTSVDGWINERYSTSIGHRRWFLSPFLKSVAFGRVDRVKSNGQYWVSSTMYVWDSDGATDADVEYIACPFHDYPFEALDKDLILSFSVLANKSNWWSNSNVLYQSSTVQIKDDNQNSYTVQNLSFDNDNYGLPNNIQWKVQGLEYNKKYTVTISNVSVNGQMKNYSYWFKIVK